MKLNIPNWKKLRKHLESVSNRDIDQDTFCADYPYNALMQGIRMQVMDLRDLKGPGCLAWHAVVALGNPKHRLRYLDIGTYANTLLGLPRSHSLFIVSAIGWPQALRDLYFRETKGHRLYRRWAMLKLVDRIIKCKSIVWR